MLKRLVKVKKGGAPVAANNRSGVTARMAVERGGQSLGRNFVKHFWRRLSTGRANRRSIFPKAARYVQEGNDHTCR